MANALIDRLAHNAHQILTKGESYKKPLPKPDINLPKICYAVIFIRDCSGQLRKMGEYITFRI
jgi:hypothetical protein